MKVLSRLYVQHYNYIVVLSLKSYLIITDLKKMDVIELSDSDEDNSPVKYHALNKSDEKKSNLSDFDLEFPSVNFEAINYVRTERASKTDYLSKNLDAQKSSTSSRTGSVKEKQLVTSNKRNKSESDSDYESQYDYLVSDVNNIEADDKVLLDKDDDEELGPKKGKGKGKKTATKTKKVDEEKKRKQEEKQQERLRKKEEAARLKAEKQLHAKNRLVIKADYSMKMMEIIVDNEIQNLDFYINFLRAVQETETKHETQSQIIPKSITWNRTVEDHYINDQHEVCSSKRIVNEDHVIVIWDHEETIKHMSDSTFVSKISNLKSLVPGKNLFLVIYKVEPYFKFIKNSKDRAVRDDIYNGLGEEKKRYKSKMEKALAGLPKVSRKKFEELLIDIQLQLNVSTRLIENEEEMALLIHQYTRALGLLPSKLEKRQDATKVEWFISSDSRDTVKVDKDGNGLKRLWQQQLCQFTLMSLESAEAITALYQSPLQLMEAYSNCTPTEGEILLRDVPIRRAAGPMTSVRRIGPELSKKLYVMFTSEDGSVYLNE